MESLFIESNTLNQNFEINTDSIIDTQAIKTVEALVHLPAQPDTGIMIKLNVEL